MTYKDAAPTALYRCRTYGTQLAFILLNRKITTPADKIYFLNHSYIVLIPKWYN